MASRPQPLNHVVGTDERESHGQVFGSRELSRLRHRQVDVDALAAQRWSDQADDGSNFMPFRVDFVSDLGAFPRRRSLRSRASRPPAGPPAACAAGRRGPSSGRPVRRRRWCRLALDVGLGAASACSSVSRGVVVDRSRNAASAREACATRRSTRTWPPCRHRGRRPGSPPGRNFQRPALAGAWNPQLVEAGFDLGLLAAVFGEMVASMRCAGRSRCWRRSSAPPLPRAPPATSVRPELLRHRRATISLAWPA